MLKTNLPVLVIGDSVLFPYTENKYEFDNINDKKVLSLSDNYFDGHVLILASDKTDINSLPKVGIIGEIKFKIDMPNGLTKVSIKGINRVNVHNIKFDNSIYEALVSPVVNKPQPPLSEIASVRTLKELFNKYLDNKKGVGNSILNKLEDINTTSKLTDLIVSFVPMSIVRKYRYIEEIDPFIRVQMLIDDLNHELSILDYEKKLDEKVEKRLEQNQKEFILKEKLQIIHDELGISEYDEAKELEKKLDNFDCPNTIHKRLEDEINRYKLCNNNSPEVGIIKNYIDTLFSLPWNISTQDINDIKVVESTLNSSHYGMDEVKKRIIEYIATREHRNSRMGPIICLVGPPGVGKTTIAKAISESLGRKFVKISVGGINDEAEITGHRRAYVGAAPGKIITAIKRCGVNNPVFVIDEIDKMTKDIKGDPASSLLEVLDKEQNCHFVDHFIEEEFDLSKVIFILTANYVEQIPNELRDRLEIINLSSYTLEEKLSIAKNYLLEKLKLEYEFNDFIYDDQTLIEIIKYYTRESGIRELERIFRKIFRKMIYEKLSNDVGTISLNEKIKEYLGSRKYDFLENYDNIPGVVNGLSYSPLGGSIVKVESALYPGNGYIKSTGLLGDVIKESIELSFDYIKSHAEEFGIDLNIVNKNDFHIHLPQGGVKKDGPSAGTAIITSILSLLKDKKISNNIAMTGEITLSGRILPVGGIKEKIITAITNNVKTVYVPASNKNEILELKELYKGKLTFKYVKNYKEIYEYLFK